MLKCFVKISASRHSERKVRKNAISSISIKKKLDYHMRKKFSETCK